MCGEGGGGEEECCERSGQSSFVVGMRYHHSFDVASLISANFPNTKSPRTRVACVHIAIPCKSFTFAAGRTDRVLRPLITPWDVDGLGHDLQLKVADGDRIAKATADVLTKCLHYRTPVSFENPETYYLWRLPEIIGLCNIGRTVDFHQCAFGSPWRKFTRICFMECGWFP